jgi:hypothetical protein
LNKELGKYIEEKENASIVKRAQDSNFRENSLNELKMVLEHGEKESLNETLTGSKSFLERAVGFFIELIIK